MVSHNFKINILNLRKVFYILWLAFSYSLNKPDCDVHPSLAVAVALNPPLFSKSTLELPPSATSLSMWPELLLRSLYNKKKKNEKVRHSCISSAWGDSLSRFILIYNKLLVVRRVFPAKTKFTYLVKIFLKLEGLQPTDVDLWEPKGEMDDLPFDENSRFLSV